MDHLVTFGNNAEECRNNKTCFLCCFVDFRKSFDTLPKSNIWNKLKELKVAFELRAPAIRLYDKAISKFRNSESWLEEIIVR